jgi:glycosyltransferase involved in cell wall biosynthesis
LIRNIFRKSNRERSVVFLNHSYYHFWYLSKALRRRGWDAVTVSNDAPDSPHASYYHGEDINLFFPSKTNFTKSIAKMRIGNFVRKAKRRFRLMHFAGDGHLSFYPWAIVDDDPADIVDWRAAGLRVAYTSSGCNSATSQTQVANWSRALGAGSVCDRCVWQHRPEICNDAKNLAWGRRVVKYCDLIFGEALPALDFMRSGPRIVREPVTTALDPEFWDPHLRVPRAHRHPREEGEVLVYHGVGNYQARDRDGRNIKGTPAVFAAIERLKAEGHRVRLLFCTDLPSVEVRFVQVQADIIVDQLNYGRYGATAREGMMLGKPVICYINPREYDRKDELACLKEAPLVSATEDSIYVVLKDLVLDAGKRRAIGEASRQYAMKWHSADACAERYERIYDELMAREPQLGTYAVAA